MKFRYPRLLLDRYLLNRYNPIFNFYNTYSYSTRDIPYSYGYPYGYRELENVYGLQLRKIKKVLCKYGNVMDEKYKFYITYSKFYVSNISTYKYAESLATNYPLVYFQLMNFDPIFLQNSSSVEEAVTVSIAHAKLLGWNGII
jgi:hypothetical protein